MMPLSPNKFKININTYYLDNNQNKKKITKYKNLELPYIKKDYFINSIKPTFTLKYLGDFKGNLGIETKKVFNNHEDLITNCIIRIPNNNRLNLISSNLQNDHSFNSNSSLKDCRLTKQTSKYSCKLNNNDDKNGRSTCNSLNKQISILIPKDSITTSIDFNQNNFRKIKTNKSVMKENIVHSPSREFNSLYNSYNTDKKNYFLRKMYNKQKAKSDSEVLFPKRYKKPSLNFEEYVLHHSSIVRNFPLGKKLVNNK